MEFVGEEKKIQALFSALRFEDERMMPDFGTVVARARARSVRPLRAFNLSFALATALLVCGLVSLALLSSWWQRSQQSVIAVFDIPPVLSVFPVTSVTLQPNHLPPAEASNQSSEHARALKLAAAAHRQAALLAQQRAEIREATAISSWKSPTATLLSSQNDALLNSLPQLNESVKDLKSFLPNK